MEYPFEAGDIITSQYGNIVRCTGVDRDGLRYECTDGFTEADWVSQFTSLDRILSGWRKATPEEAAKFGRLYKDRTTPNYY